MGHIFVKMDLVYTEQGVSGISFDMVYVKGGFFDMGSDTNSFEREDPIHKVKLDDFFMGQFPVTQAVWKAVMGEDNNPSFFQGDRRPVESVSWHKVQEFIQKLNQQSNELYRLPTEAEWEYAARGGRSSQGFVYAGSNKLWEVGWYFENSYGETKAVGQRRPNEQGLYGMSGNIWEWCQDWYLADYYEECANNGVVINPQGPDGGDSRVIRGGGWGYDLRFCRSTYRNLIDPGNTFNALGFRLVFSS